MRRTFIALALTLAAAPAWAQAAGEQAAAAQCAGADPNQAITSCTQIIQTQHQTKQMLAFAYNDRAWAYHRLGKDEDALRDVNMALILAPNNAPVIETRAEIYEKLGKRDQAVTDYRAALKLDPKMTQASDGLKRLNATP
ncbi:MAG TPA: tetratricopeptide repeat protein [Stellaceae bacterium]|jgi:tetratricopeptide (TPR) repeat protein|nr:tetratricopeptide repeat protein [Stellaceae bacterium]